MCGIAGTVGPITSFAVDAAKKMSALQVHRGPDGDGFWQSAPLNGLGPVFTHRRLAIIDLSINANQPMIDRTTGNVIVFNGEIYNYASLRRELEYEGAIFITESDTEVILMAYRIRGEKFLNFLRGIFAFAIWDNTQKKTLFVRDHLGVKPLYYFQTNFSSSKHFVFASELRSLLHSGLIQGKLDSASISSYMWNGFVPGPGTIIKGIQLLPSGSVLEVDPAGEVISLKKYWSLPSRSEHSNDITSLRHALTESVKLQQVGDVPIAVLLSGGIDSSAVANLAAANNESPIQTFNIAFEEPKFDESVYAKKIASKIGAIHHEILLTERDFLDDIYSALNSLDQPTFDGINTYFVSKAVRASGIKVALAGTGGDELFAGYKSFSDIALITTWARRLEFLPGNIIRVLGKVASRLKYPHVGKVPAQQRWGKLADALLTRGDLVAAYQIFYGLFTTDYHNLLIDTQDSNLHCGIDSSFAEECKALSSGMAQLDAISAFELTMFLGQRLLRDTDTTSMSASLEVRVPLLDHKVVEEVFKISAAKRYFPLAKKRLLQELAMPNIDPSLFEREKSGFVLPLEIWSKNSMKTVIEETFRNRQLTQSVGLNQRAILDLFYAFQAGVPGIYWSRIWAIYALLHWCRHNKVEL